MSGQPIDGGLSRKIATERARCALKGLVAGWLSRPPLVTIILEHPIFGDDPVVVRNDEGTRSPIVKASALQLAAEELGERIRTLRARASLMICPNVQISELDLREIIAELDSILGDDGGGQT